MRTLGASDNHATVGSNVDSCNSLVMAFQFVFQCKFGTRPIVEFDIVVSSDCEGLLVGGEGMVCNGVVEEVMDFWTRHRERGGDRRSSLLSQERQLQMKTA